MRVAAARDISGLLRVAVPRGTRGTVSSVRLYGTIEVSFDNGRTLGVSEVLLVPVDVEGALPLVG